MENVRDKNQNTVKMTTSRSFQMLFLLYCPCVNTNMHDTEIDLFLMTLYIFNPRPTKFGRGVMASTRMSGRPSVRVFFPEQISEIHGGISFILHARIA